MRSVPLSRLRRQLSQRESQARPKAEAQKTMPPAGLRAAALSCEPALFADVGSQRELLQQSWLSLWESQEHPKAEAQKTMPPAGLRAATLPCEPALFADVGSQRGLFNSLGSPYGRAQTADKPCQSAKAGFVSGLH